MALRNSGKTKKHPTINTSSETCFGLVWSFILDTMEPSNIRLKLRDEAQR